MTNKVKIKTSVVPNRVPTIDNIGFGELALNVSDKILYASSGTEVFSLTPRWKVREAPSGDIDGINTQFTLSNAPITGMESLYYNGQLLEPGVGNDYTLSGNIITMNFAPLAGARLRVTYQY